MTKAIFIDYTGTLMNEESRYAMQIASLIAENSSVKDIREVIGIWWGLIKKFEAESYLDHYITEDEILLKMLEVLRIEYGFSTDEDAFVDIVHKFWTKSPAFDDVAEFFGKCPLPIYVITNNDEKYINVFLDDNGLKCEGVIYGDMVRAYKPHREIFNKALEICGCKADEVIHVGDSVASDVEGAKSAGIRPILLDRKGKADVGADYIVCRSLGEVLRYIC